MSRLLSRVRRLRAEEHGFSLVEVLAATLISTVVLGGVLSIADTTGQIAPREQERAHQIRDAQVGLHAMTRRLRQSYDVVATSATSMQVLVGESGASRRYVFDCNDPHPTEATLKRCVRWEVLSDGSTSPKTVHVERVSSAAFTYEYKTGITDPVYARLTLKVPAKGERKDGYTHLVVLDDGVYMRNIADV